MGGGEVGVDVQQLLDAMEGVAYAVDPAGVILACGRPDWDLFAARNGAPHWLASDAVVGRNLFEFIRGDEVAGRYRGWLEELASRKRGALTFGFRCDAPHEAREMRMAITRLEQDDQLAGFLFQCTLVGSTPRPPVDLYDPAAVLAAKAAELDLPLVMQCSFCSRLRWPDDAAPERWIGAEAYYREGGSSAVRLSHGICPDCYRNLPA